MGTDRENVVPGNVIIIWKLNKAWPLKKNFYGHFLTALKLLKLKENSTTALRLLQFLILKKVVAFLRLWKFLIWKKIPSLS